MPRCPSRGHCLPYFHNADTKRTCYLPRRDILKPLYRKPRRPSRNIDVVRMRARGVDKEVRQRRVEEPHAVPLAADERPEVRKRQIHDRRLQREEPCDVGYVRHTLADDDVREQRRRQLNVFDLRKDVPVQRVAGPDGRRPRTMSSCRAG